MVRLFWIIAPLIFLIIPIRSSNRLHNSEIYYKTPFLNVANMNLTLAASFPLERTQIQSVTNADKIGAAMAICQADLINQKRYPPANFNGTINIAIQSYNIEDSVGQYSTMKLFANSLYNATTDEVLTPYGIFNLAGFFGVQSSGVNRINAAAIAGDGIPLVNPGTIDQADIEDKIAINSNFENRTFYSSRDTIFYTSFNVVLDIMAAYNWTICSYVFQDNILGFASQQYLQNYASNNSNPIFACSRIFTPVDKTNVNFVKNYCKCLTSIDTLTVVNLWMNPLVSFQFIRAMKNNCKAAKDFVFIVSGDSQPLPPEIYFEPNLFKTTLLIRPFGPLNVTEYLNNCLETATSQAKTVVNALINSNLEEQYYCYRKNDSNSNLPICPTTLKDRKTPCLCTGLEFDPQKNTYIAQNFFFADSISIYANVIGLIQRNCTLLKELAQESGERTISKIDFCKLENITPAILSGLLTFANFTGFTGHISFPNNLKDIREVKPFYLYNVKTTIAEAVLVGNFSYKSYYLNKSVILLPSGNDTISELVPQNPSIKYAAIAVFFGIMIALLILSLIAFVFLLYYFDHPIIRKNTPLMSLVVLTGNTILLISGIVLSTGLNDTTCIFYIFASNFGFSMMIGGIIAKSYRIYKIFNNRSAYAVDIGDRILFLIVFLVVLYFVLIALFITIAGLKAVISQSSSNPYYLYYRCVIDNRFWEIFLTIFDNVSLVILRLIALALAWATRKVVSSYNESRAVTALVLFYFCLDICFIPLYFALKNGTDSAIYKAVIRSIYICLISGLTLALLFYARFYKVYRYQMRAKKRRSSM